MKKLAQILKKDNRGFTLVEIIVVLAILAILIAVAIPSLSGVMKDSQGKVLMQDARAALVAIQLKATENVVPTGTRFLELIDSKGSTTISATVYYTATNSSVTADTAANCLRVTTAAGKDPDFKIVGLAYSDSSKRSGDKIVAIPLDGTATVCEDQTEADAAIKADYADATASKLV